jgi:allantoinase
MNLLSIRGERIVTPDGIRAATVHVRDGRIAGVGDYADRPAGVPLLEAGPLVVSPGLVDTHVHINDPGRADWEGVESATRAAAAGGITTLVDMPLNSIPATTAVPGLDAKIAATRGRMRVDLAFWGGVVPGNAGELTALAEAGVRGYKCFLSPSGVDEFEHVAEADLRRALPVVAALRLPLLVHAELPSHLLTPGPLEDPRQYGTWLRSRPPASEQAAVALLIRLAREYGAWIHVVHLSSSAALADLAAARAARVPITVETCPHYLTFAAEEIPNGATAFKCAPPIREGVHRDRLWQALDRGEIDLVASDHSPAPPAMKRTAEGDFLRAWGGIASLQLGLAAVWAGAAPRGVSLDRLARWMSEAPARLAGLGETKGAILAGRDADLILWDPDAEAVVDEHSLFHRHPLTPYAGRTVRGRVHTTLLRGTAVYREGDFPAAPAGRHLLRRSGAPGATIPPW